MVWCIYIPDKPTEKVRERGKHRNRKNSSTVFYCESVEVIWFALFCSLS